MKCLIIIVGVVRFPRATTIVIPLTSITKLEERNPSNNINNNKHDINKKDLQQNKLKNDITFEILDKFIDTK